jgi:hypothetical protein
MSRVGWTERADARNTDNQKVEKLLARAIISWINECGDLHLFGESKTMPLRETRGCDCYAFLIWLCTLTGERSFPWKKYLSYPRWD